MRYSEVDPAGPTANEGDSAGLAQMSVAWGRRFATDLGDGRWDVLDIEMVASPDCTTGSAPPTCWAAGTVFLFSGAGS